ncbi:hypothetical protein WMY93_028761 [Mugilogobius chulae]|uniref:VLIG-type G domain-containing protein n=1 Tax=Mugilogobius chulae TaxID=88201 RepID=A0AAW0MZM7_9GOBI
MNDAGGDMKFAVNPLDLVTAVFMCSNTFLQQEIVSRMVCCHFAVPLVLPNVNPQESGSFLIWPLRSVFSKWRCYNADQNEYIVHKGELATTPMSLISCVRLGECNISKSQVLNSLMQFEAFLHKSSTEEQQPHTLANGLVEIAWYRPSGDESTDTFPDPVVLANLRGDACAHDKTLTLLCQASSAIVIFCGNLQEKEKQLVSLCKNTAKRVVIVVENISDSAEIESSTGQCTEQSNNDDSLLQVKGLSVEDLANKLCSKLKCVIADKSTCVTLLAAAQLASNIDLSVDEGPTCRKAMTLAEQVLEDLDKGSAQYQEKQLPLQGLLWRKLAEIEKEERKHKMANKDADLDFENKKKDILEQLSSYKMTPAMKIFTDALFTNDKMERTYFLNWMKLKLTQIRDKSGYSEQEELNALLRVRDCSSMPICQIVAHDENISTILQSRQLNRVSQILQTKKGIQNQFTPKTVIGPWNNESLSEPVSQQYGNTVMAVKSNLINALKELSAISEATSLPLFMGHLCTVWDAVRADSFTVSLQNTDIAFSFSILCTELSQWESTLEEHMERWLMEAIKKIFATKTWVSESTAQNDLLNKLMDEVNTKVITEVDAVILKLEDYWVKDQYLKMYSETLMPMLASNMEQLKERVTHMTKQRLMRASENHFSSSKMRTFGTLLKNELEIKLHELIDYSRDTKILQEDKNLEEEFESVWCKTVTAVDLLPPETEDITPRVIAVLRQNLNSRGLSKHMNRVDKISQTPPEAFEVCVEHTAPQNRGKYIFKEHKKNQRSQAQQVASCIIDQYNRFVTEKSRLELNFSDSYITELLEIVEKTLSEKNIDVRSAFEVDLKVYLCSVACKDFQKLHDSYITDTNLIEQINATKAASSAEFVYQFRKRDQGQRAAHTFISQVIKPVVLDYIYKPLGMKIVAEIQSKYPGYESPFAFYQNVLEELLNDNYENFMDFTLSYDAFRQSKIQGIVLVHLLESGFVNKWRHQRLGEIIGKIASAVSQIGNDHNRTLSNTKLLLENVLLVLRKDIDIDISHAALDGPLFDISVDWNRFVTYAMEELASVRLQLSQEFSEPVEGDKLLEKLQPQPQAYFVERLRGCVMCCPSCRAPCEVNDKEHTIHLVSLHRPKCLWPPELLNAVACNTFVNTDSCRAISSDPSMSVCCEAQSMNPALYWRYLFAKFSEQHQVEIPEEWRKITQDEALGSLKEIFNTS